MRKWRVLCPDGIIRTATETREPDVWFAANARISYKGKTVQGSVSAYSDAVSVGFDPRFARSDDPDMPTDARTGEQTVWEFHPYTYLTNGRIFEQEG